MNYSTYRFTLDIHKTRSQVSIPVLFQDTWVQFFINLTDGGKPYTLEEVDKAVLFGKKADHTEDNPSLLATECEFDEDRTRIIYTFNEQTASALGPVECEIRLYSKTGGLHLTTPSFVILVEDRVVRDDDVKESTGDISAIDRIIENAAEWEDAEDERKAAEASRKEEELKRQEAEQQREALFGGTGLNSLKSINERIDALSTRCDTASNRITRIDNNYVSLSGSVGQLNTWHWEHNKSILDHRDRIAALEKADLAPKEYVDEKVEAARTYADNRFDQILGDGATEALDGIAELARALGEDKNYATTMAAEIAKKVDATEVGAEIAKVIPQVTDAENGMFLRVEGGKWAAVEIPYADGEEY